jgi:hypothetical protein
VEDAVSYKKFLRSKLQLPAPEGIADPGVLGEHLFPFQSEIVRWALRRGRAAVFADTGLGKTPIQLEWARTISAGGQVLTFAPLAVAQQTVREGQRFGIDIRYVRDEGEVGDAPIVITNYERFERFDVARYHGVILDESSILKSFTGKTKRGLVEACASVPFRLACTATPAPNDHLELGNHAEFLGVMTSHEMIARWFINDTSTFGTYRLKGHAVRPFWDWVASWAICCARPSDLGHSDEGYDLPELRLVPHVLDVDLLEDRGEFLFRQPELSATAIHKEKRRTVADRTRKISEIVAAEPDEDWIIWCDTNYEADALKAEIPEALDVRGSHPAFFKEAAIAWFLGHGEDPRCGNRSTPPTGGEKPKRTPSTGPDATSKEGRRTRRPASNTTASGSSGTKSASPPTAGQRRKSGTGGNGNATPPTKSSASKGNARPASGRGGTQTPSATGDSRSRTASRSTTIAECSPNREALAPSAESRGERTGPTDGSTSITATTRAGSEDFSAPPATSGSGSSKTTRSCSRERPPISGRILLSKPSIFGWGLNLQTCARMAFTGATFSYEAFYQAIRRAWRFGQRRPVDVHVVMAQTESSVWSVLTAKRDGHDEMRAQMSAAMRRSQARESRVESYKPTVPMALPSWLRRSA